MRKWLKRIAIAYAVFVLAVAILAFAGGKWAVRHYLGRELKAGGGTVQEKEKAFLAEIIERVNDLFEGDLSDQDKLVYVNNVIKGKLLESEKLRQQAINNTKEQFANSPDLKTELLNAIMGALDAHNAMSTQALNSEQLQQGLKDVLLNNAGLYESLRSAE